MGSIDNEGQVFLSLLTVSWEESPVPTFACFLEAGD